MDSFWQDVRFSWRGLRSKPGFTFIAVLTLAIGIGANTAIFSVVNSVLLRPLPFQEPDRLVVLMENLPKLNVYQVGTSPPEFLDYKTNNEVFSDLAASRTISINLTGQGEALRLRGARVSTNLFPMLGCKALYGRVFLPDEEQPGHDSVAVISYPLWQSSFGADPAVINQTVKLDDQPFTIVGVMPPQFQFPITGAGTVERTDLWVPLAFSLGELESRAATFDTGLLGRLKPKVSLTQAQTNVAAIAIRFQQQYPDLYSGNVQVTTTVVALEKQITEKVSRNLLILLGAVGLVLVIACTNVANLLLAQTTVRQKEIAIRTALGASPLRMVRQMLTESLLLTFLGGGTGLVVALWVVEFIARFGPRDIPRIQEVAVDHVVLGFTALVSLLTSFLFGLAPALHSLKLNLNDVLKAGAVTGVLTNRREGRLMRSVLVVIEVASAFILLIGSGLLVNSFAHVLRVPPGFNPEGLLIVKTAFSETRYQEAASQGSVHRQVIERLAALPGVQNVGLSSNLPLHETWRIGLQIEGDEPNVSRVVVNSAVSDQYFQTMGMRMAQGRGLTAQDREGSPDVVVVNQTMARRYWGGAALGKRIKWRGWKNGEWLMVVGVVADTKLSALDAETDPAMYVSIWQLQRPRPNIAYVIRTSVDSGSLASAVREQIREIDPDLPVYQLTTMHQTVSESVSQRRFAMFLLTVFALSAMLLAAIGLYGVISYSAEQRNHEIGIRVALGAKRWDILKLVVGQGMGLAFLGIAIGFVAAWGMTHFIQDLLFGISPTDPITFIGVAGLLTAAAFIACFIPALKAIQNDPIVILRNN